MQVVRRTTPIRSVVVSGEASESDCEEETAPPVRRQHSHVTPLHSMCNRAAFTPTKYSTMKPVIYDH